MKGFDFLKKLLTLLFATVVLFSASPAFAQHCDVKKGDSMWRIAKRYNVEFRRVLELNRHYKNPHMIHPRDEVELPDGTTGSETSQSGQGDTQKENDKTADQNSSEQAKEVLKLVNTEVDDPPKIAGRYTLSLLMKLTLLNLHQSIPALSL
ncbi:LysM peptidoglycan-binding domain-containing protein [Treponema sp.]|uniref:LysM peptidoglycan-binding domain-containing protein n=1 Tax=Treponema sp. TaxID=166 RepID=UPI00298E195F|nr:LysM peptidoglycan-binding domain-containing protein [Treponema sp.]MCQ2242552.1 LysM peptidoglycan-binding domain-containing protein [Treponema sp.]